jgi:uncharacterized membrane protein YgdD (TMEM256/DUF423 family)
VNTGAIQPKEGPVYTKLWFVTFAVFGFLGVALGAFGAHALKDLLDEYERAVYDKAVFYHMVHTFGLLAVGVLQHNFRNTSFSLAGCGFLTGIVMFSGSLYALSITGIKWLGFITPIGGLAFLFGWVFLVFLLIRERL